MKQTPEPMESPMNQSEFRALMEEIRTSNEAQAKYAKRQYFMSQITAAASIVILGIVLYVSASLLPKANATFSNMELIMTDLKTVTSELAGSDLDEMLVNINHLVTTSEESIQDAMLKIDAIDIDTLNQAIRNLSDVIEPLAKFFQVFGR